MLWFFEKQRARLRYEIRTETDGPHYELVITHPDGREEVETFSDPAAVAARSATLQNRLAADGWRSPAAKIRGRRV